MPRALLIAALAVATPLIGWSAFALVSGGGTDPEPAAATSPRTEAPPDANGSTDDGSASDQEPAESDEPAGDDDLVQATEQALSACATEVTAGRAVVTEARTGVGHWREHIEARTDFFEGRITDDEMREIWKRTRLAGPDDLERFAAVLSTYDRLSGCEELSLDDAPDSLHDAVQTCLDSAASTASAAVAATDAIADWSGHLDDMAMHKDGHMEAHEAQDKWVEAWENAPANIEAFNDARDELDEAPDCAGPDE